MPADQKKDPGPEAKTGAMNTGQGTLFIADYSKSHAFQQIQPIIPAKNLDLTVFCTRPEAMPRYQRDKIAFQVKLGEWDDMIKQLEETDGGAARIKEAKMEREKLSIQYEIQLFEAPLKDNDLQKDQREAFKTYLDELRAQLEKLEA